MFSGSRLQGLAEVQAGAPLLDWCSCCPLPPWHTSLDIFVVLSVPKESALALHEAAYVSDYSERPCHSLFNYIKAISKLWLLMNGAEWEEKQGLLKVWGGKKLLHFIWCCWSF